MYKKFTLAVATFIVAILFVACSTHSSKDFSSADSSVPQYAPGEMAEQIAPFDNGEMPEISAVSEISRKIILNSAFELQTKDYDLTIQKLNTLIDDTKSYIEASNTYGDKADGNANVSLTIRVPSDKYEEFKTAITELGNIISSSESGNDVTGDYFDTDSRLTVLKAQEKRVLELLAKAETIEDILKIETELTRLRAEIEQLTTVIKRYDDLISYSTINVNIHQTKDYIVKDKSFFDKIADTMKNSLEFGLKILENLVYAFVWLLPYIVIVGLIVGITLLCIFKSKAAKKRKNNLLK